MGGLDEVSQELQELSGRFGGQLERDAGDRKIIRFHGGGPSGLLRLFLGPEFGITRGPLLRLLEPIAFAGEDDDAAGVGEDLIPFAEGLVERVTGLFWYRRLMTSKNRSAQRAG